MGETMNDCGFDSMDTVNQSSETTKNLIYKINNKIGASIYGDPENSPDYHYVGAPCLKGRNCTNSDYYYVLSKIYSETCVPDTSQIDIDIGNFL